jgi:hypothetical protein
MSHPILNIESLTALVGKKFIYHDMTSLDAMVQGQTIAELPGCTENAPVRREEVAKLYYFQNQSIHEIKARS